MRIRDVAHEANVSTTAVSYALNGTGRLDDRTRERIIEVAHRLGYRANPHARNLRRNRRGVLGLVSSLPSGASSALPNMDYFGHIWRAAITVALERDYMLLMMPFGTEPATLDSVQIDGGIVVDPLTNDVLLERLESNGHSVVTIGRDTARPREASWWVDNDFEALTAAMLDHFEAHGARRVAAILSTSRYSYSAAAHATYTNWVAERRAKPLVAEIDGAPTESAGYEAASRLLASDDPPDAIYASLDRYAVGTLFAATARGLRVPQDLMIGAGSDGVITQTARVPLTALELHPDLLGRHAVEMLLHQADGDEGGSQPEQFVIPGSIQYRASTAR